jgi:O-antigen/teichoic acid export membrane protein
MFQLNLKLIPLKNASHFWYVPILALAMGLMMLRMLMMAYILDVPTFGEFSAGLLVSSTFCMVGCFGLQPMLQREWPMQIVRRTEQRALVRALQCFLVAAVSFILVLIILVIGFTPLNLSLQLIVASLLHGLAHQWLLISTIESRSRGDVLRFSYQNLQRSGLAFILSIYAAYIFDSALISILLETCVAAALSFLYLKQAFNKSPTRVGLKIIIRLAFLSLNKVSLNTTLTLTMVMVVSFSLINIDRWLAALLLGVGSFAQYSFAWIILTLAQSAQLIISAALFPLMARRYAKTGRSSAYRLCMSATISILVFGFILSLILVQGLAYLVNRWYSNYIEALGLLPWFLAIAVFRMSDFCSGFLLVCGRESLLLGINIVAAVFGLIIWFNIVNPVLGTPLTLFDIGLLPILLSFISFIAVASGAWFVQRKDIN